MDTPTRPPWVHIVAYVEALRDLRRAAAHAQAVYVSLPDPWAAVARPPQEVMAEALLGRLFSQPADSPPVSHP